MFVRVKRSGSGATAREYLQIVEFNADLTGSSILADKPVAVFGGNPCIGIGACCCDNAAQQIPPVRALGHEYAAVRYRGRMGMNEARLK